MITALILSGGTGTRLGGAIPKQYIEVDDKPVIGYCLDTFEQHSRVDQIVIVAADTWQNFIAVYVENAGISKFVGFAPAGKSRQHSILSGLEKIKALGASDDDIVIIHDAARPCVSNEIIDGCIDTLDNYNCAMPVISVKDTVYYSDDGKNISSLLNRDKLFAGQAPESCKFGKYYRINKELSDDELSRVRGTSAIAYDKGLNVGLFPGSEANYKITTVEDLNKFKLEVEATK
jgi:D-ribitol-5-phosphate cytidylyltransferase